MREEIAAAILAGGVGSRLRPVVADRPKVLAPVAGRPFLAHLLAQLDRSGFGKALLLVGYKSEQVRDTFGNQYSGVALRYAVENELRGTGGAVRQALPLICEKTILLMNGDSFCHVDLRALVDFHHSHGGKATLTLAWVKNAARFGRVALGPDDRIAHFGEKEAGNDPGWINAGIYVIDRVLFERVAADRTLSLEKELLPGWVAEHSVFGFRGGEFIDIGVPESYARASDFFSSSQTSEVKMANP